MITRCVIVDDEPLALTVLEDYIKQMPELQLIEKFTNAVKAIDFLNENEVDLLFFDIQMPDLTGFEMLNKLKHQPVLIFTTAYGEYAMKAFKADAIDYLLKPIDLEDFSKAVNKATEWIAAKKNAAQRNEVKINKEFLFIKSEYKIVRLNFNDIKYIQGMGEYVQIHLQTAKQPIVSLLSLKSLETQLPENKFMRVHKSFIVNLEKINMIERNEIIYEDGVVIPVSQQYKAKFQEFLDNNFMV
jgi:two-component system LytT family response regulator